MPHACAHALLKTVSEIRSYEMSSALGNGETLGNGVYFSWDSEEGSVAVSTAREGDQLFNADVQVSGKPRWLNLSLALNIGQFNPGDVLGLILDWQCSEIGGDTMIVRSSIVESEFDDTHWQQPLAWSPQRQVMTFLHTTEATNGLIGNEKFHTIIIPLPSRDFQLTLFDMQFFVLPTAHGLRNPPTQLSGVV